jgi:hypothetical protein
LCINTFLLFKNRIKVNTNIFWALSKCKSPNLTSKFGAFDRLCSNVTSDQYVLFRMSRVHLLELFLTEVKRKIDRWEMDSCIKLTNRSRLGQWNQAWLMKTLFFLICFHIHLSQDLTSTDFEIDGS